MSFPRYPEYKNSGVEWLGDVPRHWEVLRLKHTCEVFPSNVDKHARDEEPPVRLCNYTDVYYNERITADMPFMEATASEEQIARFTLKGGDTIVTKDSETADDIAIAAYVPEDLPGVVCGYHLSMVRPRGSTCGAFVKRLFDSAYAKAKFEVTANGLTRVGLGQYALDNVELPFPPQDEQQAIASFLDRETAKIDVLVAEQEKLITLLKEKRQVVISHAVTKGLDPTVPMKDSGVEWLGEVPVHWEAITLRRCVAAIQTGGTPSSDAFSDGLDDGSLWYTPGDFGNALRLSTSARRVVYQAVAAEEVKVFPAGSVLIVSIGATLGKVGFAQEPSSANQQINAVIPSARVDGYFLAWSLSVKVDAMRFLSNASTIGIMNQEKTKEIWIAVPPRQEQHVISDFLDQETSRIDALTCEAQSVIALLQERRAALISAAVTGQIDVRSFSH